MAIPDIPNAHALAVLLLTVLVLILFTREKIALEPSSLYVLVVSVAADMGMERFKMFDFVLPVVIAGGYKFSDFVKVGTPLTLLMWVTLSIILSQSHGL